MTFFKYNAPRPEWGDKPYFSLSAYLKNQYGEKVYKLSLDGGFTCPNRDGRISTGGCIFCSSEGSGDFATKGTLSPTIWDETCVKKDVYHQIEKAKQTFGNKKTGQKYIAYFGAFTGTYAPKERLLALYRAALSHPDILGLSIATRPDCLGEEVQTVLETCQKEFRDKFIWVELGLQTIHEQTARYINRGYPLSSFEEALSTLERLSIPVIVHVILGLPFETKEAFQKTISYLNKCKIFGIKLQLLHVLRDTRLAGEYEKGVFDVLSKEEYLSILIDAIDHLRPDIVIHRVTGDGPQKLLLAPTWSQNKRDVLNSLHKEMRLGNHYQGKQYLCIRPSVNKDRKECL